MITAAHCMWHQKKIVKPEALLIYLGKHDLFIWNEPDVQSKDVSAKSMPVSEQAKKLICRYTKFHINC